jgi:hypothetical protein
MNSLVLRIAAIAPARYRNELIIEWRDVPS